MVPKLFALNAIFLIGILPAHLVSETAPGCPERKVIVSAMDSHGAPVFNLTAKDFRASYRGHPVRLNSAEYWEHPSARITVLLDMSGSMNGENGSNKWKVGHNMASEFVSSAPSNAQISLMAFAGSVKKQFNAVGGRQSIEEWLASSPVSEGRQLHGGTALFETITGAIHDLSPSLPGDSIYVITDADDNRSRTNAAKVQRALSASNIRLFVFFLHDTGRPRNAESETTAEDLENLSVRSGGMEIRTDASRFFSPQSHFEYDDKIVTAMRNATHLLQTRIFDFYLLKISDLKEVAKQKNWTLELVDAQGNKREDVGLNYPHSPPSCPAN